LPALVGRVAEIADGGLQAVGLYNQKIHVLGEMDKTIACSIAKARSELGYAPKIGLREGMKASIEWCLANGQAI
jgi:nucleoside-diphosphate-sugar epimerase